MPTLRAALLFSGCALLGMSLGSAFVLLIAFVAGDINQISSLPTFIQQLAQLPNGWYILIAVQAISHLCSYLLPALVYWYWFEHRRWTDFQTRPLRAVPGLWIGLLSVIVILPFNELIIHWNQQLPLPRLLGVLGEWMHRREQESSLLTNQLVAFHSTHQLGMAVLVIGLIASLGEEVFFRGIIQRKFIEWTASAHLGIWLAAALFSAVHFQFYGFFPRLLLGLLFGYLYYWSGNLWVAILAHLINNSLVVITLYRQQQPAYSQINFSVDTTTWFWIVSSLLGGSLLLFRFYQVNHRNTVKLF